MLQCFLFGIEKQTVDFCIALLPFIVASKVLEHLLFHQLFVVGSGIFSNLPSDYISALAVPCAFQAWGVWAWVYSAVTGIGRLSQFVQ